MEKKLFQPLGGNVMPRFGGPGTMMRLPSREDASGLDACFIGRPQIPPHPPMVPYRRRRRQAPSDQGTKCRYRTSGDATGPTEAARYRQILRSPAGGRPGIGDYGRFERVGGRAYVAGNTGRACHGQRCGDGTAV